VEGFPDLSSQFAVGANSMDSEACMWGALVGFGLVYQLRSSSYCIRFYNLLYLMYSFFCFPHIYIHIPNWFSPGGFYPGSC
jgi:hypothetical protein